MHSKIREEIDIRFAVLEARAISEKIGFKKTEQYMISTVVSELATNIFFYAKEGFVVLKALDEGLKKGLEIIAKDSGPGIANIALAITDNYSTTQSLGCGLPGVQRLMDDFKVESELNIGTTVTVKKWL